MPMAALSKPAHAHHWSAGQHRLYEEADIESRAAAESLDEILVHLCEEKDAIGYSTVKPGVDCGAFDRGPFKPFVNVQLNITELAVDRQLPSQQVRFSLARKLRELAALIES